MVGSNRIVDVANIVAILIAALLLMRQPNSDFAVGYFAVAMFLFAWPFACLLNSRWPHKLISQVLFAVSCVSAMVGVVNLSISLYVALFMSEHTLVPLYLAAFIFFLAIGNAAAQRKVLRSQKGVTTSQQ